MTRLWEAPMLVVARGFLHTTQRPYTFVIKNSKADYLDHLRADAWTWSSFGERGLTVVSDRLMLIEPLILQWSKLAKQVEADRALFERLFKRRPACEFEKEACR